MLAQCSAPRTLLSTQTTPVAPSGCPESQSLWPRRLREKLQLHGKQELLHPGSASSQGVLGAGGDQGVTSASWQTDSTHGAARASLRPALPSLCRALTSPGGAVRDTDPADHGHAADRGTGCSPASWARSQRRAELTVQQARHCPMARAPDKDASTALSPHGPALPLYLPPGSFHRVFLQMEGPRRR